jgi:hypothetical protein
MKLLTILAIGLLSVGLIGCKDNNNNDFKTCWSSGDWKLCYSKNVMLASKNPPTIMMEGRAEPHYLVKRKENITNFSKFIVRYKAEALEGAPYLKAKDCATNKPGTIAAFFQRAGDDMYAKGEKEYYRWWSRNRPQIELGEHEFVVSLNPADNQWISVLGKGSGDNQTRFNNARKYIKQFGVTFGGCGNAGHGILVQEGKMKITILDVRVE